MPLSTPYWKADTAILVIKKKLLKVIYLSGFRVTKLTFTIRKNVFGKTSTTLLKASHQKYRH
jgi:hypothetical protein